MARIRDWLQEFLERHHARFHTGDWPDGNDPVESAAFAKGWLTAFAIKAVTEAEAEEASVALVETPPNFRREHIPAIVAQVEAIRRLRGTQPGTGTREVARDRSRGCEHCWGEGLVTVWAERPDPARKRPMAVAAYCVCDHGRWIKRNHADRSPELLVRRPGGYAALLDLNDLEPGWLVARPADPDDQVRHEPVTRAQINGMFPMPAK